MKNVMIFFVALLVFAIPVHALDTSEITAPQPAVETALAPAAHAVEPAVAGPCTDDPRITKLAIVIKEIEQNGMLDQPVTLTPERYLKFKAEVLEMLGDNVIICPDIPVLGGVPAQKIKIRWDELFPVVLSLASQGDAAGLKKIQDAFVVEALPAAAAVSLVGAANLPENKLELVGEAIGVKVRSIGRDTKISKIYASDIFTSFGGQSSGVVYISSLPNDKVVESGGAFIKVDKYNESHIEESLRTMGMQVFSDGGSALQALQAEKL